MADLTQKKCLPCEGGVAPLTLSEANNLLGQVLGWQLDSTGQVISRDFTFKNFYQVMAFVNAVAWLAHQENHHPDLEVGYQHCLVRYSTHAIGGLSENDFICAAKVNGLFGDKP
ncbi:MAG TPA: 4a-hydroxytetrahydrobiopterin dehydratase [Gammaproteobacteria bacterium]|nr:4a-hydroxytetrahydrobiopterin dehydratase [Gammaproteobacteria bacterium]